MDLEIVSIETLREETEIKGNLEAIRFTIAGESAEKIAHAAQNLGAETSLMATQISNVKKKQNILKKRREAILISLNEIHAKVEESQRDTSNLYVVIRALSLGAIGALASIFATQLFSQTTVTLFNQPSAFPRIWLSMIMGAIVGVTIVGLFYSGFISIFPQSEPPKGNPDFWKVTMLCLIAGAFSERLFIAASARVDKYAGVGKPKNNPDQKVRE